MLLSDCLLKVPFFQLTKGDVNFQKVFVKANFLKVTDINTIKEEFSADVYVTVRWREPTLDNSKVLILSF